MKRRLKWEWFGSLSTLVDYVNENNISKEDVAKITIENRKWYLLFWG